MKQKVRWIKPILSIVLPLAAMIGLAVLETFLYAGEIGMWLT